MDGKQSEHPTERLPLKDTRLRIVVCLSHFHPTVGGAERQLLHLARHWASWGHTVHVITRPLHDAPHHEMVDQITIRRSKTDQDGVGRKVGIPYGGRPRTCPVRAPLVTW